MDGPPQVSEVEPAKDAMPVRAIALPAPEELTSLFIMGGLLTEEEHFLVHPVGLVIFDQKIIPHASPHKRSPLLPAAFGLERIYNILKGVTLFRGQGPFGHLFV